MCVWSRHYYAQAAIRGTPIAELFMKRTIDSCRCRKLTCYDMNAANYLITLPT